MKIYRYETPIWREGPYRPGAPIHDLVMSQTPDDVRHLTWEEDENLREVAFGFDANWLAATASRKDLALWFAGLHKDLLDAGYQLVCYEVPTHAVRKAYRGHQVAFHSESARGRTVLAPHVQ